MRQPDLTTFGITLAEIPVATGARPLLLDGTSGVTMDEAISSALSHSVATDANGQVLPGVQMAAWYGLFTNSQIRPLGAHPSAALYQNVPAWIVTFTGDGVNVYSSGPPKSPTLVNHAQSVVIDAKTGGVIESVS